jgi:hypothetical protein
MRFECPEHGFVAETSINATVLCVCRRKAHPACDGRRLHREEVRRIKASQKTPANQQVGFRHLPRAVEKEAE